MVYGNRPEEPKITSKPAILHRLTVDINDEASITLLWSAAGEDLRVIVLERKPAGCKVIVRSDMMEAHSYLRELDLGLEDWVEFQRAMQWAAKRRDVKLAAA